MLRPVASGSRTPSSTRREVARRPRRRICLRTICPKRRGRLRLPNVRFRSHSHSVRSDQPLARSFPAADLSLLLVRSSLVSQSRMFVAGRRVPRLPLWPCETVPLRLAQCGNRDGARKGSVPTGAGRIAANCPKMAPTAQLSGARPVAHRQGRGLLKHRTGYWCGKASDGPQILRDWLLKRQAQVPGQRIQFIGWERRVPKLADGCCLPVRYPFGHQ